jgi:hypothetical protein
LEATDDDSVPHALRCLFVDIQPKDNGDGDYPKELPADALWQPDDYLVTVKHRSSSSLSWECWRGVARSAPYPTL